MKRRYHPIDIQQNGHLPIRCFTGEQLLPDEPSREQLHQLATVPGLRSHIAVLPDVHYKSRNPSPTGTVVVSQDVLVPRAIDGGINCGMRMMATSLPIEAFTPDRMDALYGRIIDTIPYKTYERPLLSEQEMIDVLTHGQSKLIAALGLPQEEQTRVENGGRMIAHLHPDDIVETLTPAALSYVVRKGGKTLGTIGGGNHFLELQEIIDVLDEEAAAKLGLKKGHVVFMLHTDSRRLGKKVLEPLLQEATQTYGPQSNQGDLWTLPLDSDMGRRYVCGIAAASHAGFANRAIVTHILRQTLRQVFADPSLPLSLLYDCGHETIQPEEIEGERVWVHRHGASHALPAAQLASDPVLGQIGQPVPLPGNMGSDSYIAVARQGTAQTFYSVAHGAGRVIAKDEAAAEFDAAQVQDQLRSQGIRLYRYGIDNIAGQAPASFKDAHQVLDVMKGLDLVQPVVRVRPRAVLKG